MSLLKRSTLDISEEKEIQKPDEEQARIIEEEE